MKKRSPPCIGDARGNYVFLRKTKPDEILELAASILERRIRKGDVFAEPDRYQAVSLLPDRITGTRNLLHASFLIIGTGSFRLNGSFTMRQGDQQNDK